MLYTDVPEEEVEWVHLPDRSDQHSDMYEAHYQGLPLFDAVEDGEPVRRVQANGNFARPAPVDIPLPQAEPRVMPAMFDDQREDAWDYTLGRMLKEPGEPAFKTGFIAKFTNGLREYARLTWRDRGWVAASAFAGSGAALIVNHFWK